jgi:hypothetical protein
LARHRTRDFETIGPENVECHISHQLELALVGAGLDPLKDVGSSWRLGIEVPPDDGIEPLEASEGGEVEIGKTIGRKDDSAMRVEFVGMHSHHLFDETFASLKNARRWGSGP